MFDFMRFHQVFDVKTSRSEVCWRCMNRAAKDEEFGKVPSPAS